VRGRVPFFLRSIRFRLTAWYAILLLLLIVTLFLGLAYLLERELRQDVDDRLLETATSMNQEFQVSFTFSGPVVRVPPPDSFSFPSQLIEVVGANRVWFSSENLGDRRLLDPDLDVPPDRPRYTTTEVDGVPVRVLSYPIRLSGQTIGLVSVGEPLIQLDETLDQVRRLLGLLAVTGVGLAAVGGWFLATRALAPVDRMTATAGGLAFAAPQRLSLSTRLDVPATGDELSRLALTFNALLDRLESAFETQQRFIADASHELRTPLTAIRGNVDLLSKQLALATATDQDVEETIQALKRESERMARLTDDLLTLARAEAQSGLVLQKSTVELEPLLREAIETVQRARPTPHIRVVIEPTLAVVADRDRLAQVLVNLLDNAVRYTPTDGVIDVMAAIKGDRLRLTVNDTGSGINAAELPHVFDRFFRAESARQRLTGGTGLGLAIVQAIVRAHQGTIQLESEVDRGTMVTITLPDATL
jgi:two-component system, OmpR family, sensor kinase